MSTAIFGASSDAPPENGASAVEKTNKPEESKRNYGFATKNLRLYSDKNSEDLYRFKNLSSDYMRSSNPTREEEEDKSAAASGTGTFVIEENDSDDDKSDEESTSAGARASSSKHKRSSKK